MLRERERERERRTDRHTDTQTDILADITDMTATGQEANMQIHRHTENFGVSDRETDDRLVIDIMSDRRPEFMESPRIYQGLI